MVTTQNAGKASPPARCNRRLRRLMAASTIVIGVLAVASPSWAGPMMGC